MNVPKAVFRVDDAGLNVQFSAGNGYAVSGNMAATVFAAELPSSYGLSVATEFIYKQAG